MKKLIFCLIICLSLVTSVAWAGRTESYNITDQNQFTNAIKLNGQGLVFIEDTGSMSMTVCLQASYNGVDWIDTGDTWTTEGVHVIDQGLGARFRVGVKTGAFTSGTATITIMAGD